MAWKQPEVDSFEWDGNITDAIFEFDDRFTNNDGDLVPLLKLTIATSAGFEREDILGIGAGWEIEDGGRSVSHPTRETFSKQSRAGTLIDRILKVPGAIDYMGDRDEATSIDGWIGLEFHWKSEEHSYKSREGEQKTNTRYYPVSLVGDDSEAVIEATAKVEKATAAKPPPAKKAAPKKAAKKAPAKVEEPVKEAEPEGWVIDPEIHEQLKAAALGVTDHDEFIVAVWDEFGVGLDEDLETFVMDEGNWEFAPV